DAATMLGGGKKLGRRPGRVTPEAWQAVARQPPSFQRREGKKEGQPTHAAERSTFATAAIWRSNSPTTVARRNSSGKSEGRSCMQSLRGERAIAARKSIPIDAMVTAAGFALRAIS